MQTQYFKQKRKFYKILLSFIDCNEDRFQNLSDLFEIYDPCSSQDEFSEFLHLILKIIKNHHRDQNFFHRMEEIFQYFKNYIKQSYSNSKIFDICSSNKLALLILFKNEIITVDETITDMILNKNKGSKFRKYRYFFYTEIKPFIKPEIKKMIEKEFTCLGQNIFTDFEEKKQKGENDSYICSLIRND